MKRGWVWIGVIVLLGAAGAGGWWWWSQRAESAQPEYRTARVERGVLRATVSASGTINPVASVQVSSQVSGQLQEVLADYNSEVRKGQVLARIDAETFRQRVNQAQADLDAAHAQVLVQESQVSQRRAEISRVEVNLAETRRDLARKEELVAKNFIAPVERERVAAQVRIQEEDLKTARAGLEIALAQVRNSQALVRQRQAALAGAQVDLERTVIRSPVDGIVIKRSVEAGQTVAASLQAPEMFLIARNLRDMQVDTSIDESDISRIQLDQKASFTVDAFPGRSFEGTVSQVRKAAQNVQNVITYIVVVTFANADGALQPGMTANVRIVTEVRQDVLKIVNAALRFRLPGETAGGSAPAVGEGARAASVATPTGTTAASSQSGTGAASTPTRAGPQPAAGTGAGAPAVTGAAPPSAAVAGSGGGGGGGGQLAALRERLEQELSPTPEQRQKLETIFAAAREKFVSLREAPEDQRGKLAGSYRAELRAAVGEILSAEQKPRYEALLQELAARAGAAPGAGAAGTGGTATGAPAPAQLAGAGVPGAKPSTAAPAASGPAAGAPAGPGSGAGGGQLAAFRARLEQELAPTPAQRQQLEGIFAAAREKFAGLRTAPDDQRGKLAQTYRAELRAAVGEILTPEQKKRYEVLLAEIAGRAGAGGRGRIYLLENGKPRALSVRTGISDGTATEVSGEGLAEGAEVIIGIVGKPGAERPPSTPLPRML